MVLWAGQGASARDVVSTSFSTNSVDLTAILERFETEKPQFVIQLPPDASGTVSTMTAVAQNFALRHRWAVFSLRNQESVPQDLVVSANWQGLVGSGLYWPRFSRKRILSLQSSPGLPATPLDLNMEDAFAFRINPGETVTYAIEVSGEGLREVVLWKRAAYTSQRQEVATFQGLLLGFALLISIMVVCLFVIRPQWVFPAAALFVWSATGFLALEFGFVRPLEDLFPNIAGLAGKAKASTEALMTVGLLGCILTFVELRKRMVLAAVLVIAAMIAGLGLAGWAWFRPEIVSGVARMGFGASAFAACVIAMTLASQGAVRAKASLFFFAATLVWAAAAFVGIEGLADIASLEYLIKSGLVLVMGVLALILARFAFSRGVIHSRFFEDSGRRALALAGSEQCVWDWQEESGLLYVGPELERALGLEQGLLTRGGLRAWLALIHPADRAGYVSAVEAAVARGRGTFSQEFRLRRADGSYRWYELRARAMPGEHGRALRCIGTLGDITASKRAEESLLFDAVRDRITDLPNRVLFIDRLDREMLHVAGEEDPHLHVLVVDIDRFKNVNDSLGHVAGDALLRTMARRLGTMVSSEDTLARLSGDQFGVITDTTGTDRTAEDFANDICRNLAEPCEIGEREVFLTASVGIASFREETGSAEDFLKDAEIALYEAKRNGKDSVRSFEPAMRDERPELLHLESELRRALQRDEMEVLYQPIMRLEDRELAGFEALIRWRHPKRGLLLPEEFISLAEESGLIEELGGFVLNEAARQLGIWQRAFRPKQPLFMSINVSHAQLLGRNLVDEVRSLLSREDLAEGTLKLEITESMVMENPELSVQVLRRLKQMGVGLACDDFGTGYSSLATLQRLPFDVLKLDKSFLEADPEDDAAEIILQSIIDLGANLQIAVVAEGVESEAQAERLQDMGCDFAQGYLFGEPMTSRKVVDSLGGSALLLRYTTAKTGGFFRRLIKRDKNGMVIPEPELQHEPRQVFRPAAAPTDNVIPPPPPPPAPPQAIAQTPAPASDPAPSPPPPQMVAATEPEPQPEAEPVIPPRSEEATRARAAFAEKLAKRREASRMAPSIAPNMPPPAARPLPARADQLTRISGIDYETARLLSQMNYGTYRKIANMNTMDITLVNDKLGSPGRVEREEWIRQAGEILTGRPPVPAKPATAVQAPPVEPVTLSAPEPAPEAFAGFAATPPLRAEKKEPAPTSRFEARLDQISQSRSNGAEPGQTTPVGPVPSQPNLFASAPEAAPQAPPPAAPAAPPAGTASAANPAPADNLSLIAGIGPTMASDLKGLGIVTFQQLANLSDEEAENVNQQTGFPGRVEREEWREQARELMAGKAPRAKVDREQLAATGAQVPPAPVPEPPVPEAPDDLAKISGIGPTIAKNLNAHGIFTYKQIQALSDAEAEEVDDLIGFPGRVKREQWREQATELMAGKAPRAKVDREAKAAAPAAAAKPEGKKLPAPAPKSPAKIKIAPPSTPDDLTKIKGVGPALARELHSLGFHTFHQLAELSPDEIAQINDQIGFPGRVERENWVGQAKDFGG